MNRIYHNLILAAFLCCLLLNPPISKSQTQAEENPFSDKTVQDSSVSIDEQIQEMLQSLLETGVIKELELSGDRSQYIIEKLRHAREIRQQYLFQRYHIENRLYALLEEVSEPDETKLHAVLDKLEIAKMHYYQEMIRTDNELQQMLTPEEQARYILFQREFQQKLKEVIAKIRLQHTKTSSKQDFLLRKHDQESVIRQPH